MTKDEALRVLEVDSEEPSAVSEAFRARKREIEHQISFPELTAEKRQSLRLQLATLSAAHTLLVSERASNSTFGASDSVAPKALIEASPPVNRAERSRLGSSKLTGTQMVDRGSVGDAELAERMEAMSLAPGTLLAGRYEIIQCIGAGGMGIVYSALDNKRQEEIAVKVLASHLTADASARERFTNEAKISSQLSHPNIVNVYDVQQDGDMHFITMELLLGGTLRQEIVRRKAAGQNFSIDEVRQISREVLAALEYAHKLTVHRDIKPENIWLSLDFSSKLMDFGIARLLRATQFTQTAASMGTVFYMAPEQAGQAHDVDGRADQYAFAVVIYELLTMQVPAGIFRPIRTLRKDVPESLSAAVATAMSREPSERFPTVGAFRDALLKEESRLERSLHRFKQHRTPAIAGVVMSAVLAVAASANIPLAMKRMFRDEHKVQEVAKFRGTVVELADELAALDNSLDEKGREAATEAQDSIQLAGLESERGDDDKALSLLQDAKRRLEGALKATQETLMQDAVKAKTSAEAIRSEIEDMEKAAGQELKDTISASRRMSDSLGSSAAPNQAHRDTDAYAKALEEKQSRSDRYRCISDGLVKGEAWTEVIGQLEVGRAAMQDKSYANAIEAFNAARNVLAGMKANLRKANAVIDELEPSYRTSGRLLAENEVNGLRVDEGSQLQYEKLVRGRERVVALVVAGNFEEARNGVKALEEPFQRIDSAVTERVRDRENQLAAMDAAARARAAAEKVREERQRQDAENRRAAMVRAEKDAQLQREAERERKQEEAQARQNQMAQERERQQMEMAQQREEQQRRIQEEQLEMQRQEQARQEQLQQKQMRYQRAMAEYQHCVQEEQRMRQQLAQQAAEMQAQQQQACAANQGACLFNGLGIAIGKYGSNRASDCDPPRM